MLLFPGHMPGRLTPRADTIAQFVEFPSARSACGPMASTRPSQAADWSRAPPVFWLTAVRGTGATDSAISYRSFSLL